MDAISFKVATSEMIRLQAAVLATRMHYFAGDFVPDLWFTMFDAQSKQDHQNFIRT